MGWVERPTLSIGSTLHGLGERLEEIKEEQGGRWADSWIPFSSASGSSMEKTVFLAHTPVAMIVYQVHGCPDRSLGNCEPKLIFKVVSICYFISEV